MRIGVIVYSHTGNTLRVAQLLKEAFVEKGHTVHIEEIRIDEEKYAITGAIVFQNTPDLTHYEALVFGSPVRGGNVSPMMVQYLNQVVSLQDKTVACYVTHYFPFAAWGGNQALSAYIGIFSQSGIKPYATGIISWMSGKRQINMDTFITKCLKLEGINNVNMEIDTVI